ncbi:MAG: hypothetical protein RLY71_2867 [Pseudomonadota bacterium]|jgi:hemoglobin
MSEVNSETIMMMNAWGRAALRVVAGAAVVLSLSSGAMAADKTLYERLGGKPALEAVVGELWKIAAADQRINARFANTKPEIFAGQLVDFLCQASGGPCQYKGQDMKKAHTGMRLTEAEFNALAEDIVKVLDKFKVPAKEHNEVMTMLGSLKGDIINR